MPTDASNPPVMAGRPPKPGKKYFGLQEANRSLTYVSRIADDVSDCYGRLMDCRRRLEAPQPGDSREHLEAQYEAMMDELGGYLDELQHMGVELKDFEMGLIDFPAITAGREIYLCWKRGESRIQAWHEVDAGYAGRQDVALLREE